MPARDQSASQEQHNCRDVQETGRKPCHCPDSNSHRPEQSQLFGGTQWENSGGNHHEVRWLFNSLWVELWFLPVA
ncbi:MAG: hypothetical protein TH68_00250 [Candidatus Synechococcus spongiarum 142]|uniref:Uncharacterized protein n=1 Tax=Candidatus Synechococcus spongiarum 142 TaxID=1608213 RepID=A0A6N3X715_9SYNE|nr:MAG: hypothetical protein TH68_00250 [Candidatus Synechococcus spongiarum 142]